MKYPPIVAIIALVASLAISAAATDKYSSGGKTWDTSTSNWGTSPGNYSGATWMNAVPDSAFLEGSAGTVTLGTAINIKHLNISIANYIVSGNQLNFDTGGTITNTGVDVTISSAISGSPTVRANQGSNKKFTFAPSAGTVTLGPASGANDGELVLGGTTSGNSLASSSTLKLRMAGSATWTLTGLASAYEHWLDAGNWVLIVAPGGALSSNSRHLHFAGGTLHYNHPGAVVNASGWDIAGRIDNTSGAPIASSTTNPKQDWTGNWTFIGSLGASSDLHLGNGAVLLTGTRMLTVSNSATTLTIGGPIGDGGNAHALTKAGAGTLKLTGNNTYTGDTTINAGTLSITQPYLSDIAAVRIAGSALLNLDFSGTNEVFDFYTNGVAVPKGTVWGAVGSGAPNQTTFITGSGRLNVPVPQALAGVRHWDGGTTDIGGNGNELSEGGAGTWSTSIKNWDAGVGVAHSNWNNSADDLAIFRGTAGTVTLAEDINLGGIFIDGVNNYIITGNALNFGGARVITNSGINVTISSAIIGSPTVTANQGSNDKLAFAPTAGSVALGAIGGSGLIEFGGSTTGNSIASMGGNKGQWNGSGTWTLNGNAAAYEHFINSGTLIVNGLLKCNSRGLHFSGGTLVANGTVEVAGANIIEMSSGVTLKGTGVINDGDLPTVPSGATVAPGDPTGTLTLTNNNCAISGTLDITVNGENYSAVDVDGELNISSATLDVTLIKTYAKPMIIATYNSRVGEFATVNLPKSTWEIEYDYESENAIALIPPAAGTLLIIK